MTQYTLKQVQSTGKNPVFYANSKRVGRDKFEMIKTMSIMYGNMSCFQTIVNKDKVTHYCVAAW